MHLTFWPFFFSFLYLLSFGCFDILYTCGMVCVIPCFYLLDDFIFLYIVYMFLGLGQKTWPPCLFRVFFLYLLVGFFSFSFILDMHLSLRQKTQPPYFLGVFSFIYWLFFLLFSYIVDMFIKTNVTCVSKSVLYNS
jgi:hypothetical protein